MRALSLALSPVLSPSLSLSRSLSPCSLARSLGVCVHARMRRCVNEALRNGDTSADVSRSQSHKARAFRDGGASADVSRHRGRRLQDNPREMMLFIGTEFRDCAVPDWHAPLLGRRRARARVGRSRVACDGVCAVPARAGWGRGRVGAYVAGREIVGEKERESEIERAHLFSRASCSSHC